MLDTNRHDSTRIFCVSTKVNANPPVPQIWRNYNYPLGQSSRYPGSFRVNTKTSIRASTAAPTFFTPVQWEGGLYCDGALVANNPTAIAVQEAKALYPGVPIELVVSIGTGTFFQTTNVTSMGWDLLVGTLIASSTDTEDTHLLLADFLPTDMYYRFNPTMQNSFPIDEKSKDMLASLKTIAKDVFKEIEANDPKRLDQLVKALRGKNE